MYHIYLLKCKDGSIYTGITNDLKRRLAQHQAGKASRYTRSHGTVKMLYTEKSKNRSTALKREMEIKGWARSKKLALAKNSKKISA